MIDVEPLIRTQLESLMPLPEGSRSDWTDVLERSGHRHRRSRRRLLLALAAGVCVLVVTGVAIAAGVGAFSGKIRITIADAKACKPSTTALTTASGARVLTGHTDAGVYCFTYEAANGGGGSTANTFPTPAGEVIPGSVLDTVSHTWVVVGLVPPGYDTLSIGSQQIPIRNQVFVIDPKQAVSPGTLSGPAGTTTINLSAFADCPMASGACPKPPG
jgi:hypothetical protein